MGCMININHGKSFIMDYNLRVYGNGNGHGMYNRQYMDIWVCLKIDITKFDGYLILYFPNGFFYFMGVHNFQSNPYIYIYLIIIINNDNIWYIYIYQPSWIMVHYNGNCQREYRYF